MSRSLSFWGGLGLSLFVSLQVRAQGREGTAMTVDPRAVVALAAAHSPTLQASLLDFSSARWTVHGLSAQYTPVFTLEANATQTSTPNLFNASRTRQVLTAASVRKHLLWGTDVQLQLSAGVQDYSSNRGFGLTPGGSFGPGYGLTARLTLTQPLLRGRGREVNEAELASARITRTNAERRRDRVASEVIRDVLIAYWELWYATEAVGIHAQSREVARQQRDEASARVELGSLAPTDLLSFERELSSREEEVLAAQQDRDNRQLELRRLVGVVEDGPDLSVQLEEAPSYPEPDPKLLEERALTASPELRERKAELALAEQQAKVAGDPNRHRLDVESYVQTQGLGNDDASAAWDQLAGFSNVSAFVGLTYEAPLSSQQRRADFAKARIAVENAETALRATRQLTLTELRKSLASFAQGKGRLALAEKTAQLAEQQRVAEQARFSTGSSTALAVQEADAQHRQAKLRVARAQADLAEASLALQHLSAGLLAAYADLGPAASAPAAAPSETP